MHGGHEYIQTVSGNGASLPQRLNSTRHYRRQLVTKVPTVVLQEWGPAAVAAIFDGGPSPAGMSASCSQMLRTISGRHRSVCMAVPLPALVADAQTIACSRQSGRGALTINVCTSCTIAHVKVDGVRSSAKKRFGVIVELGGATVTARACSTCGSSKNLWAVSLIGRELHARCHPSDPPTVFTVCCACGSACARGGYHGPYPMCRTCLSKPRKVAHPCLCGAAGVAGPMAGRLAGGNQLVNFWLCSAHLRLARQLPFCTVYPMPAILRVTAQSVRRHGTKRKYVYLR